MRTKNAKPAASETRKTSKTSKTSKAKVAPQGADPGPREERVVGDDVGRAADDAGLTPPETRAMDEGADGPQIARAEIDGKGEASGEARGRALFPIVGIGASAGGLEALEEFLKNVSKKSGMAYVVIQHLDPARKGAMVELLQRVSSIPVVEASDRQAVAPDHVYVIPPNKDMSLLHGALHLLPQTAPRGLNLPIDFFFRSLAEDRHDGSIAVVLSGMGSDGTLGLRAIKEKAGTTFVQSLSSAKFDGMPRSAIDAGLADVVAPAEELPARIFSYHQHAPYIPKAVIAREKQQSALEKVFILLRAQSGNDFSLYKHSTVQRRIERRMGLHQLDAIGDYVRYLRENPRETELLFKELLIGVTSFFRDPEAWDALRKEVLPDLLKRRAQGGVLRAWVPACSTGEEAYSLAVVLSEAMDEAKSTRNITFQIFATDLDKDAIDKARQGLYPSNIAADVSPERLRRFFLQDENGYRVRKELRERIVFAPQNIVTDPPFTKLDILSCRNLLIYLSSELQKKLIPLFHYSLLPAGVLFLGTAETIGGFSSLFSPLDAKTRLYRRLATPAGAAIDFPAPFIARDEQRDADGERVETLKAPPPNLQTLADRVIVARFAPAGILVTDKGDILYISGRTGKYLEPAVGKANLNVFAMAREGLRYDLSNAFATALKQDAAVVVRGVRVRTNGSSQSVDLTVQRLTEPKELRGTVMIVVADANASRVEAAARPAKSRRGPVNAPLVELERELQHAREEAQTTREEMQTSQEELRSSNEELQSTNEELQSTNEELTTSKEEMQSMNEELQTVNQELQAKVDDLARSSNDMRNLLNSTDIATLFLDGDLRVRRFTTPTTKLIKLIPSDAGRPITDIATDLDYPEAAEDAREVLQTLVFKEKQVAARDGRWFTVRTMPYRTLDNVIDGVVITFTDSTAAKVLERALREQASQLRQMADALPSLAWVCRADGACEYVSRQWVDYTGIAEERQLGNGWLEQIHPEDRERVRDEWTAAVRTVGALNTEFRVRAKNGAFRWFKAHAVPIRDEQGLVVRWSGTGSDVHELKHSAQGVESILEWTSDAMLVLDGSFAITTVNVAAETLLGRARDELQGRNFFESFPETVGTPFEGLVRSAEHDGSARQGSVYISSTQRAGNFDTLVYLLPQGCVVLLKRVDDRR